MKLNEVNTSQDFSIQFDLTHDLWLGVVQNELGLVLRINDSFFILLYL